MEDVAEAAYAALAERDWDGVRLLLHPYLHWSTPDGRTVRGRTHVLTQLESGDLALVPPVSVELRDGQIYRWRSHTA